MSDPIPGDEKVRWLGELIDCQNQISEEVHEGYVGRVERVLFDGASRTNCGMITGRTDTNLVVDCKKNGAEIGDFADVEITRAARMALVGEIALKELS